MAKLRKYSVSPIESEKIGIVNNTLTPAPLYKPNNPYFLYAPAMQGKLFLYRKVVYWIYLPSLA